MLNRWNSILLENNYFKCDIQNGGSSDYGHYQGILLLLSVGKSLAKIPMQRLQTIA